MLQSLYMCLGQIVYMDVIANACAIRGGIIIAKNSQLRSCPGRSLEGQRNQVGLGIMALADFATFIGAGGIKVAQAGKTHAVGGVVGLQSLLKKKFGDSVRVHRLARGGFRDWCLFWNSVHGAGGRKNNVTDTRVQSGIQKGQPALHIVAKIFSGILYGFAHVSVGCKMHDRLRTLHHLHQLVIGNIADHKLKITC